jgi:NAD(P)-dependent dehydrogenase (short-subunit alcohol dehydrogenase family)
MSLKGKVAVVTGGNGGIGLGFATGLAQAGADIAIWARNIEKSDAAVAKLKSLGVNAKAFNVDVADKNQINQGMIDTEKEFGGVDILVANANINEFARIDNSPRFDVITSPVTETISPKSISDFQISS